MSVFLRWGIFGILGFAALLYAYNASKKLAEGRSVHQTQAPVAVSRGTDEASASESQAPAESSPQPGITPRCQAELEIARRALEARRQGEPVDRLLRIQEIAFQEQPWRERLESVATRWYQWTGEEPTPEELRDAVVRNCELFTPAP
jgi:hypothetical protein